MTKPVWRWVNLVQTSPRCDGPSGSHPNAKVLGNQERGDGALGHGAKTLPCVSSEQNPPEVKEGLRSPSARGATRLWDAAHLPSALCRVILNRSEHRKATGIPQHLIDHKVWGKALSTA